jgi:cyclic pyranopterin phosphate synthase
MVDVSGKTVSSRTAVASGFVKMSAETIAAIRERRTPKGDALEVARIAGVMAAKRTADLIPLCHPLPLNHADVQLEVRDDGIAITATATTDSKTGVEMEALTAASVTALTLYDMCKALDKGMVITDIRLESKSGGSSGDYQRRS